MNFVRSVLMQQSDWLFLSWKIKEAHQEIDEAFLSLFLRPTSEPCRS